MSVERRDRQEEIPQRDSTGRRPYSPPQLGRVSLEADQVLGVGCKTQSQVGNTSNPPMGGYCGITPCSAWGT
jgi:hypothetical protein